MLPNITQILQDEKLLEFCQKHQLVQPIEDILESTDWTEEISIKETSEKIQILIQNKLEQNYDLPDKNVLFGIPQGAQFVNLRKESALLTMELDFPGYSVGGVANGGEPEEVMYSQVLSQTEILEEQKPRHLLGVGTPKDIVQMVARGIDMFDCVYPTRNARHGSLICEAGEDKYTVIHINSKKYQLDFSPINEFSKFEELRTYTKAYLCHLFRTKELLAYRLATVNNLEFYLNLMNKIREKIAADTFKNWWEKYDKI